MIPRPTSNIIVVIIFRFSLLCLLENFFFSCNMPYISLMAPNALPLCGSNIKHNNLRTVGAREHSRWNFSSRSLAKTYLINFYDYFFSVYERNFSSICAWRLLHVPTPAIRSFANCVSMRRKIAFPLLMKNWFWWINNFPICFAALFQQPASAKAEENVRRKIFIGKHAVFATCGIIFY